MNSAEPPKPSRLSQPQYATIRRAFSTLDINGDGEISRGELSVIMQCLGHKQTNLELQTFIRRVDTRGKGTINFNDFTVTMASSMKEEASDRDIRQAFMVFDQDNDGVISPNELRFVMDIIGERLSHEQLKAVMKEADFDGDGAVTYRDFCQLVRLK